ncbi:hypothetical protein ACIQKB_37715 [Streptomyces sp. NPDC092046]|uniref:DUF6197 family protein n=1 Tax=Streptomyces sp. NPDC092046 TaxID=3366009 RepID=UPI00382624AD
MPDIAISPALDPPAPTTRQAATAPPAALTLEERLTLVNAEMTARLDEAAVAYEVNTAHIPTEPVDLADIVTVPLTPTLQPAQTFPTPVAGLFQRARHRLLTDGWCTGTAIDAQGARCLYGAIRAEAAGDYALQQRAIDVLQEAIRRAFGDDADSVPAFNDAHATSRIPLRMLDRAALLADARGL